MELDRDFYMAALNGYSSLSRHVVNRMGMIQEKLLEFNRPASPPLPTQSGSVQARRPVRPRKDTAAPTQIAAAPRKRRKLTAAARKAISVAQKARWKAHRAAKK